jgi:hypothetical protein
MCRFLLHVPTRICSSPFVALARILLLYSGRSCIFFGNEQVNEVRLSEVMFDVITTVTMKNCGMLPRELLFYIEDGGGTMCAFCRIFHLGIKQQ